MTLGLSDDEDGPNDLVRVSCRTRYPEKGTRGTMVTEKNLDSQSSGIIITY